MIDAEYVDVEDKKIGTGGRQPASRRRGIQGWAISTSFTPAVSGESIQSCSGKARAPMECTELAGKRVG